MKTRQDDIHYDFRGILGGRRLEGDSFDFANFNTSVENSGVFLQSLGIRGGDLETKAITPATTE